MAGPNGYETIDIVSLGDGLLLEWGNWWSSLSVTIETQTTRQPQITEIVMAGWSSDGDKNTAIALDGDMNEVKLTVLTWKFGADLGKYWIIGRAS